MHLITHTNAGPKKGKSLKEQLGSSLFPLTRPLPRIPSTHAGVPASQEIGSVGLQLYRRTEGSKGAEARS
ncbi:hypothetical protein NSK_006886 [Nannochloropsis salina CCMP1776]|uniref:Uncharacterized protein n=1 Tax=Nannochloropsis salina CCMP1776 TaxID=1027361 RepID=A0A4D9CVT7_9STRA|nr:hypothetical protein NSK_006886 [Nannochloropsis salina CCMP1776]|eukprot:TFJ81635.1 hypothetical protein NSK_006886 [Nannochloropsis salina CCMP1776]